MKRDDNHYTGGKKGAGSNVRFAMLIDLRRCIGCHACSVACKAEYEVPVGRYRSWVKYTDKGKYPNVVRQFLPRLCNHCEHAGCERVCPTSATYKRDDGTVQIEGSKCIGCKYCMLACPYEARFINPVTGTADKCSFCVHRVDEGIVPACVQTCIGEARIFGDVNDPKSEISEYISKHPVKVLNPASGNDPHVYYIGLDEYVESLKGGVTSMAGVDRETCVK
ncbi:MAG: 4Fe-4S dicluster domain-containing protein [Deltaproteobacteria bacterium]|nr:4Fe-4S dicluster domain-containing protein [Deltaproteobacteria bacterium]